MTARRYRGVQRLDGIGAAGHLADLEVVVQERDGLLPGAVPEPDDRRVPLAPFAGQVVERGPGSGGVEAVQMGLMPRLRASQSRREARWKVLRIRWMTQVWTIGWGQALPTTSGRPLSPSQTTKNTSLMPRLRRPVSTAIQNLAPSPPAPSTTSRASRLGPPPAARRLPQRLTTRSRQRRRAA